MTTSDDGAIYHYIVFPKTKQLQHVTNLISYVNSINERIPIMYSRMSAAWKFRFITKLMLQFSYFCSTYQSRPSKSPSPFKAEVLKIAHWRFLILCNSRASVTAASSRAPGRSCIKQRKFQR